jgi:phospholipid/cholesterol/gamma-HCH transport system substrate-binding protein
MSGQRQNTIVGLFALTGLLVLAALVFMSGGGRGLFRSTYSLSVWFPRGISGLQTGQGVTLSGKRIGETTAVEFKRDEKTGQPVPEQGVVVVVDVDAEFDLPAKSTVVVATSLLSLGRPSIQIMVPYPTDAARLPKDGSAMILGDMLPPLDQVLPKQMQQTLETTAHELGALAEALRPVAQNLSRLLESRSVQEVDLQQTAANMDTVIQRFDATLKNVNMVLGDPENQSNFRTALANFRRMSENGTEVMENLKVMTNDGRGAMKDAGVLAQRLIGTADDLSSVLKRMDASLMTLNEGQGTMGLLLRDNRLYEELVLTAKRLTLAVDDLREVLRDGTLHVKSQ